jgi:hypothetical protein
MNNLQAGLRLFQGAKLLRSVLATAFILLLPLAAFSQTAPGASANQPGAGKTNSTDTKANCSPALSALTIQGDIVVIVDPDTNIGSGIFKLTNNSDCAFQLNLSTTDFKMLEDLRKWNERSKPLGATAAAFTPLDLTTKAYFPPDLKKMPPGATAIIKVEVQKLWEAGEAIAELQQDGRGFATIYASRLRTPFNVKNGMVAGEADPVFYRGSKGFLSINNDDKVTYPVTWTLFIDGKSAASGYDYLPPGQTHLEIQQLKPDFFRLPSSGTLQDDVEQATLNLRFDPPRQVEDTHLPSRDILFPKVHLSYFNKGSQQLMNVLWIMIFLSIGAAISIALNVGIPNQLKRNETRKRLKECSKGIDALDVTVNCSAIDSLIEPRSRAITSLRVERSLLENRLHQAYWFSSNLSVELPQIDQAIGLLNARAKVVDRVEDLQEDLCSKTTLPKLVGLIPPSLMSDAITCCAGTLRDVGRRDLADADIPPLLANIIAMQQRIATLSATDALATTIPALESNLKNRIPASAQDRTTIIKDPLWQVFTGLEVVFKSVCNATATVSPDQYFSRDMAIQIAIACADYVDYRQGLSDPNVIQDVERQAQTTVAIFSLQTYSALVRGNNILGCLREAISVDKLREALTATPPKAEIVAIPSTPKAYELVRLEVAFVDDALNSDAARQLLKCKWALPGVPAKYGWTIAHYFNWSAKFKQLRRPWEVKVIAAFLDAGGPLLTAGTPPEPVHLEKTISISAERNHGTLRVSLLRTGLALFVALVALIATEQSQIANLSIVPATLAVLVAGMTADTIKTALTKT